MPVERRLKLLNCDTPPAATSETSPSATAIKVAFATTDLSRVDQHFGAAQAFALYAVDNHGCELLEVVQFGCLSMDGNEDKLAAKIDALEGCVVVYCQAVGASAVSQLRTRGIQPLKVEAGTSVKQLLQGLQRDLNTGPSAWLMRAIAARQPRAEARFDAMEAEGWSE
ncbi:NifB/NifX family molybdenum-iron cluster-binding protein [Rhabdochromatium marinum]|uniref:NifB/NifX family molybdenum-iron cluster-binding protein n=1 Tax=Rhabdochromatium marinum TaxID=48729 RepID=UPI001905AEFD|nr:NifB/NifX family molybdenum-iron cluster-binding protein [Rhabdochromatium marinum]MBK1649536.1 nitrogen fixation protein NifX [Rhabdochromatium marinum]